MHQQLTQTCLTGLKRYHHSRVSGILSIQNCTEILCIDFSLDGYGFVSLTSVIIVPRTE